MVVASEMIEGGLKGERIEVEEKKRGVAPKNEAQAVFSGVNQK